MDLKTTTRACGQEGTEIFSKIQRRFLPPMDGEIMQQVWTFSEDLQMFAWNCVVGCNTTRSRRARVEKAGGKLRAEGNEVYYVQIRPISSAVRPNQSVRNKSVELTPAPTWGGVFRLEKQIAKEGGPVIEATSPAGSPHEACGIAESQTTRTLPLVVGRSMEALTLVEQLHTAQKEKEYVELKDKGMFKDAKRGLSGSEVGPRAISIKDQELEKTRSNKNYMLLPTNRPTRHSEFGMGLRNKWVHPKSPISVPNLFTRFGHNKNKGKGLSRVSPSKFGNQREKDKVVGARKQKKGKLTTVINHYDKESADESLQEGGSDEEGIGLSDGTQSRICDIHDAETQMFLENMDVHSNIQDLEVDLGIDSDLEMGNYTGTDNWEELSSSDVESEDVDTVAAEEPGGDSATEQYLQEMFSEKDNQAGESNQVSSLHGLDQSTDPIPENTGEGKEEEFGLGNNSKTFENERVSPLAESSKKHAPKGSLETMETMLDSMGLRLVKEDISTQKSREHNTDNNRAYFTALGSESKKDDYNAK
ncbi:hypothetical protein ACE6H2_023109 [Prunus campanulata]